VNKVYLAPKIVNESEGCAGAEWRKAE